MSHRYQIGNTEVTKAQWDAFQAATPSPVVVIDNADAFCRHLDELRSPRTGETPEQILDRLAKELHCEPRQVCDRVIAMLKERKRAKETNT